MQPVTINTAEIPAADVLILSSTFLTAVNRFYEDPKHLKDFEAWKLKREQNKEAIQHGN